MKQNNRKAHSFNIHDGEASITILVPYSGYYEGSRYLVIYEDAFGDYSLNMLSKNEISKKYGIKEENFELI